jgi:hypothetical protein
LIGFSIRVWLTEERQFHAIGSGSIFARGSLKKLYAENMPVRDAVLACVQALYDAADDDSATGGPDLTRRIFPIIATVTADGFAWVPDGESEEYARMVAEERMRSPEGPKASLSAARQLSDEAPAPGSPRRAGSIPVRNPCQQSRMPSTRRRCSACPTVAPEELAMTRGRGYALKCDRGYALK